MHLINFCRTNYVLISTDNYGNLVFFSKLPKLALLPFLPLAKKLRQGNVFTPVCHSVHRGEGVSATFLGRHYRGRHPLDRHPPGQTPPCPVHAGIHTPLAQCMLRYTPLCTMHAGIPSTSGRYASYWNAYLLCNFNR